MGHHEFLGSFPVLDNLALRTEGKAVGGTLGRGHWLALDDVFSQKACLGTSDEVAGVEAKPE